MRNLTCRRLQAEEHRAYLDAVDSTIGFHQMDYAMLVKAPEGDTRRSWRMGAGMSRP